MPIYEYTCDKCNTKVEKMQKMSDPPLEDCTMEGCDGKLTKLISTSGIQFKGEGWYVTDYSDKLKKNKSKQEKTDKTDKSPPPCAESCPAACGNK